MSSPIRPGTPEWDATREEIVAYEVEATEATNAARDALLAQGDLFASIAPPSRRGESNGAYALLEQMARECGIAARTAINRRDLASQTPAGGGLRTLIQEASDVVLSWETLRTVLADDQPEALLTRLIEEARTAGSGRVTRDAARRLRGLETGTVGTPQATAERIARDPQFAQQVAEAVAADDGATVALGRAMNQTSRARETDRGIRRVQSRQEAVESEQTYHLRGFKVLPVMWDAENLAEYIETRVARDEEDLTYARNAGLWLQAIGRRIVAWAEGETLPMSDDDFASEIAALLGESR